MKDQDFFLAHNLQNLKSFADDESYLAKIKPHFSYLIFKGLSQPLHSSVVKYPQSMSYFKEYLDFIEDKTTVDEIIASLTFINEEKQKFGETALTRPISEVLKLHNWIFFEKLKQTSKGQYRIYFNDWALKNSQIIEYTIKTIFKLLLQLELITKGVGKEDIDELMEKNKTFGMILHYFDSYGTFIHLERLRIYRNAVSHPGTEFIYDANINKRKLKFEDDYGFFEVNIDEFIADFKKVLIFIATFNYMVANELFKVENDGKTVFQVNYEYAKKNGMKQFWSWATVQITKNRYYKYFLKKL